MGLDTEYITRSEHSEMVKRFEEEESRQNHRIERLEDNYEKLTDLTLSVKELSVGISSMQKELERQGERLEKIEREPGEKWNKAVWIVLTAVLTAVITFIVSKVL